MATPPRILSLGNYYHVYNRGNRKQQIFLQERDYERFVEKIQQYQEKYPVEIVAYCLMPNHIHFLIKQVTGNGISQFMSNLCNSHSRYFNVKYETVGSLFQGRFKAKLVDKDEYLIHLSRYIHLNPVSLFKQINKNLFDQLSLYPWSSLPLYLSGVANKITNPKYLLQFFASVDPAKDYQDFIKTNINLEIDPIITGLEFEDWTDLVGLVRATYEV